MKEKPVVNINGQDANAYSIMSIVSKVIKKAGYTQEEVKEYRTKAMSGDYDNLLMVSMEYVDFE